MHKNKIFEKKLVVAKLQKQIKKVMPSHQKL